MTKRYYQQIGATFVETAIVVTIVTVVVNALISGATSSLRSTNFASTKSQATKYTQEGIELARRERDISWYTFFDRRDQLWCVDKEGVWTAGAICPINIDNQFRRSIRLNWNASTGTMEVISTVTWRSSSQTHISEIRTQLTQWR